MKEILVIGLYEDTGQTFATSTRTEDPQEALRAAAIEAGSAADNLIILGTVRSDESGALEFVPPGDDNDSASYASDILGAYDDNQV